MDRKETYYVTVFDGQELLESSIEAIRSCVSYVCVVFQTVSNFGNDSHPRLKLLLDDLKTRGVVDELLFYEASSHSEKEKRELLSVNATEENLGCSVKDVRVSRQGAFCDNVLLRLCALLNAFSNSLFACVLMMHRLACNSFTR